MKLTTSGYAGGRVGLFVAIAVMATASQVSRHALLSPGSFPR
jgi:hypothetical protein